MQTHERHTVNIRTPIRRRPCSLNIMIFMYYNPSIYRYKRQFNLPLKCVPPYTYMYMITIYTYYSQCSMILERQRYRFTYREKRQVSWAYVMRAKCM